MWAVLPLLPARADDSDMAVSGVVVDGAAVRVCLAGVVGADELLMVLLEVEEELFEAAVPAAPATVVENSEPSCNENTGAYAAASERLCTLRPRTKRARTAAT